MRTRTLLLLSVVCGVAILTAGVVQLVRLAGQEESVREVAAGAPVEIGDLTVVVGSAREEGGRVHIDVEWGGIEDPDAADGFRLVVPPADEALAPSTGGAAASDEVPACAASTVASSRCQLTFTLPAEAGTSRVLLYRRGDDRVRWDLAAP